MSRAAGATSLAGRGRRQNWRDGEDPRAGDVPGEKCNFSQTTAFSAKLHGSVRTAPLVYSKIGPKNAQTGHHVRL
jgi:hypothetical protein